MLGFYTSTCYERWTAVQKREGDVERIIHNTALMILWTTTEDILVPTTDVGGGHDPSNRSLLTDDEISDVRLNSCGLSIFLTH